MNQANNETSQRTKCEYLLVIVVEDGDVDDDVVVQTDKSRLVEPGFSSCLHLFLFPGFNQSRDPNSNRLFREQTSKVPIVRY